MKTLRLFSRNHLLPQLRIATAVTLMSAAAAMAFVAGSDKLVTVGSPPSPPSQDRAVNIKMPGQPAAPGPRDISSEGPVNGYEAYKSAARTYPANVIPVSMVQNAKKTFDN